MATLACIVLCSCTTYSPLKDSALRPVQTDHSSGKGIKSTFLGNTTILISDGETSLLVDGFVSRPSAVSTLFGKIGPNKGIIRDEFSKAGVTNLRTIDAILLGHAHHDHSLDTTALAIMSGASVMANRSYREIHGANGGNCDPAHLIVVPEAGGTRKFGRFTVSFLPSTHASSHFYVQEMVEGDIDEPFRLPARFHKFKCGDVFSIHIGHPEGNILVTTTVGTRRDGAEIKNADIVFLSTALLTKESELVQDTYWNESVAKLSPKVVIPVHWDNFTRKLSKGLKPPNKFQDDTEGAMQFLKTKTTVSEIRVLDVRESIYLSGGRVN